MKIVPFEEFMARTFGGRPNQMNTVPYTGQLFACACGKSHAFDPAATEVLRELRRMRLVLACPHSEAVTCVKVKGLVRFRGFKSLFGARSEEVPDAAPASAEKASQSGLSPLQQRYGIVADDDVEGQNLKESVERAQSQRARKQDLDQKFPPLDPKRFPKSS